MEDCRSCPNVVGPVREFNPFGIWEAISFRVFKEESPNDRGFALEGFGSREKRETDIEDQHLPLEDS